MKILFIGDIVGKPGREITRQALPLLVEHHGVDLAIANVENAAGGAGITRGVAETIRDFGVDVMTTGNHVWDKKEAFDYIQSEPRLLRPANYPAEVPGLGHYIAHVNVGTTINVGVINLMGRVFMNPLDNPFRVVRDEIAAVRDEAQLIIVDFHAEATSEKLAMAWHLDGQVTAVLGTHTHVQTADARVLPAGTAYITDVGMTGPHDSIIGVDTHSALPRFLHGVPTRFEPATGNRRLNAVIVTADPTTGRARAIDRLDLSASEIEALARKTTLTS